MRKILLILLALALLIGPASVAAQPPSIDFADGERWTGPDIQASAGLGLMSGIGTDSAGRRLFAPQATINRAQLVTVLTNSFGLDYGAMRFIKQPLASDYFRDVDDQAWYAPYVVMGAINNIFPSGGDFSPARPASRVEIAQMVQRCFEAKGISVPMIMMMPEFIDAGGLSPAEMNAVVFVHNTGIMRGRDEYFRPADPLTRAEMAGVALRCVELMAAGLNDQQGEWQVPVGGVLYLSLPSNPSTGYVWMVAGGTGPVLTVTGSAYRPDEAVGPVVGQGGHQYWRFQPAQAGTTKLELVYARPWESVQPQQRFELTVTIAPIAAAVPSLSTTTIRSEGQYMTVDAQLPVLHGLADPALQARLNHGWEQDLQELEDQLTAELGDYIRYNQEHGFPIRPYELFSRYQTGALEPRFLSQYVDYYRYTGGAHGLTERRPYNFDLQTGQSLQIADLFQSSYDFAAVIDAQISQSIAADPDPYFSGDMGFQGIRPDQGFYVHEGQLVVYFGQYEIAPYANGIPEFTLPLSRFGAGLQPWLRSGPVQ